MDSADDSSPSDEFRAYGNDTRSGSSANRKHVSKACLECRKRHSKCDGELPSCRKCVAQNKVCTYVQSHRGGSRKKGVSSEKSKNIDKPQPVKQEKSKYSLVPDIEDLGSTPIPRVTLSREDRELIDSLNDLPCAKDKSLCQGSGCETKKMMEHFKKRESDRPLDEEERRMLNGMRKRAKIQSTVERIDGLFSEQAVQSKIRSFDDLQLPSFYTSFSHLVDCTYFDKDEILKNYYSTFHKPHPFFPPADHLDEFFINANIEKEMLLIMKVVGDGQISSKYNKDLDLISDVVHQCLNVVKRNESDLDIVSVQVLLLISTVAHVSSLHVLSRDVRHFCIYLATKLDIQLVDFAPRIGAHQPPLAPNSLSKGSNHGSLYSYTPAFLKSSRVQHISKAKLLDSARRVYWELYFFEIIMGSADGKTLTALANIEAHVNYPLDPPREVFDYEGRAMTGKLVSEAIEMNKLIINKKPIETKRARLRANLSSWEMKLNDPLLFGAPPLVQNTGKVNEGVHQSILLFNYANVFAYRPFSLLWKINSPQNPNCGPNEGLTSKEVVPQVKSMSSSVIDTRKTIQAADSIVESLINTNSSRVEERSPVFACALALSSLVHISAFIWEEQVLSESKGEIEWIGEQDLDTLAENIKLSLSAIYPISRHWILSGKLAKHIRDSLQTLRPNLYSKIKEFLPHVEVGLQKLTVKDYSQTPNENVSSEDSRNDRGRYSSNTSESSAPVGEPVQKNEFDSNIVRPPSEFITDIPGNNIFFNESMNAQITPVSDTGCDWIDKALMDFFDADDVAAFT